jgi:hypothetical protein
MGLLRKKLLENHSKNHSKSISYYFERFYSDF